MNEKVCVFYCIINFFLFLAFQFLWNNFASSSVKNKEQFLDIEIGVDKLNMNTMERALWLFIENTEVLEHWINEVLLLLKLAFKFNMIIFSIICQWTFFIDFNQFLN